MANRHVAPAVYAGLAGAVIFAQPSYAHAVEVFGTTVPLSDAGLAFVGGCLSGAVVASGVTVAVERIFEARAERNAAEHMFDFQPRHAAFTDEAPVARHAAEAAPAARHTAQVEAASAAKHAAAQAPAPKHAASKSTKAAPQFYGKHSAEARAVAEWEMTGAIRMQDAPAPATAPVAAAAQDADDVFFANTADQWNAFIAETNASGDYGDVADAYVKRLTLAERMSARAKGVANVLAERIGASKMDGLPVIARADGSVADMGESWWSDVFGEDLVIGAGQNVTSKAATQAAAQANPYQQVQANPYQQVQGRTAAPQAQPQVSYSAPAPQPQAQPQASYYTAVQPQPQVAAPQAQVAPQAQPAQQQDDQPRWTGEQQDLWAVALEALDDRFAEAIAMGPEMQLGVNFADEIGDADSLDEPDGLEPDTMFMTFKPTAGHPEVQDASSYVDLLIDQEFAHNQSASARKSVRGVLRNYLSVIEGTGTIKTAKEKAPAHMAAPSMALVAQ